MVQTRFIKTWFICYITYSTVNMKEFSTIHTKLYTHRMWIKRYPRKNKQKHYTKISETVFHTTKIIMTHHFRWVKGDYKLYYMIICSKEKYQLYPLINSNIHWRISLKFINNSNYISLPSLFSYVITAEIPKNTLSNATTRFLLNNCYLFLDEKFNHFLFNILCVWIQLICVNVWKRKIIYSNSHEILIQNIFS